MNDGEISKFDLRNLSQSGEPAPSPFFLDLYRVVSGRPDADYRAMIDDLESAEGFVPGSFAALDDSEWWLSRVREDGLSGGAAAPRVDAADPWLEDGARRGDAGQPDFSLLRAARGRRQRGPRRPGEPSASRIRPCALSVFVLSQHVLRVDAPGRPRART